MEAADSQGNIWFWQAVEEEEEDPEGYADEYEDENDSERPQQRAGVKKRPGLQGFSKNMATPNAATATASAS